MGQLARRACPWVERLSRCPTGYAKINNDRRNKSTMEETVRSNLRVLTIGHSNHALEHFLDLLKKYSVEVVADTRSYPYSNHSPHYDREFLKGALINAGLKYVDLGGELGGRPKNDEFYDSEGRVFYDKVAATATFQEGLSRLEKGIKKYTVAILCSEENPAICHRKLLVGRILAAHGIMVDHIRGDGRIQSDNDISASMRPTDGQTGLFANAEASAWKSIPSVSRKKRPNNSLTS